MQKVKQKIKKIKHIVFRVLNFIHTHSAEYSLTANEQMVLITLAHHKGKNGIYPRIQTLARELYRGESYIQRTLANLEKKKLIQKESRPGKSNRYFLSEKLSTTPTLEGTPQTETNSSVVPYRVSDPYPIGYDSGTPGGMQSTNISTNIKNRERKNTLRVPLSLDWIPNKKNQTQAVEVAAKVGKGYEQLLTKFKNLQISKESTSAYWDGEFENFLINERIPQGMASNVQPMQPKRSSMRDYTQERLEREAKQIDHKLTVKPENSGNTIDYISWQDAKRASLKQQGELKNGRSDTDDNNSGGSVSS